MPSNLRYQSPLAPFSANATYQTSPPSSPTKKQKMSLTQTYYVASTARSKLGREASRADHNLRRLVGHANLLDTLMVELADAEREQEAWFNQSVQKASKPEQPRHIQWIDSIVEEEEEEAVDESDDESDDGSDIDEDELDMFTMPVRKLVSSPLDFSSMDVDEDEDEDDDEFDSEHALTRVASYPPPPGLTHEADSDDEDDSMPSSPEQSTFELSDKQRQSISTSTFYDSKPQRGLQDYLVQQSQSQAPLIAAC